ncbi:MAG: PIN domain-containing protein [Candidatus Bathyarchaeia archaeon]
MKEVLDTRFLFEYFYSSNLETKNKVTRKMNDMLSKNLGILPTMVLAEITKVTCERRGKDVAESRYHALVQSGLQIQDLTPQIAKHAGLLKSQHRSVPMGDCIIAATAIVNHARVLSDDPHFDNIKDAKRGWI